MNDYTPTNWVVLRIVSIKDSNHIFYRLLSGFGGGYTGADQWRLNSGITKMEDAGSDWIVYGKSGSVYRCNKQAYRLSLLTHNKYLAWQESLGEENIRMMPENTDWATVSWN